DAMAKKTVIKLLLSKWAPLSSEMQKAIEADQAIIKGENEYEYVDNKPIDPDEEGQAKETARILKHIKESKTIEELRKCEEAVKDANDSEVVDAYLAKEKEFGGTR